MKFFGIFLTILFVFSVQAQQLSRDFDFKENGSISVTNLYGKVSVAAEEAQGEKVSLVAESKNAVAESDIQIKAEGGKIEILVNPKSRITRIDLNIKVPLRTRVRVETGEGEVRISGNVETADVSTETGTISTDVPLDAVKFNFLWTASRPRYLSDVELPEEVKEKSGGKFVLNGKLGEAAKKKEEEKAREGGKKKEEESQAISSQTDEENTNAEEIAGENKGQKTKDKGQNRRIKFYDGARHRLAERQPVGSSK